MSTSQIFTIGTALRRADDNNVPVEVLVEGQWLRGSIAGLDGDGLVLVTPERTQCVVRNAHISVVRILADVSFDMDADQPAATTFDAAEPASATADMGPASPTFSWASAYDGDDQRADESSVVAGEASRPAGVDRAAERGAADQPVSLALGADESGEVFALDAHGRPEVLALSAPEPVAEPVVAEPVVAEPVAVEPDPEPVADPVAPEPADLVSRLLAESMREAGLDPETARVSDLAEPASAPEPVELLHPEKASVADDQPRVFALPAPSETMASATDPAQAVAHAPLTDVVEAVTPAPLAEAVGAPEAVETPLTDAPVAEADTAETADAPADDWRAMLEGLRHEATATTTDESGPEKRRGRRLVLR